MLGKGATCDDNFCFLLLMSSNTHDVHRCVASVAYKFFVFVTLVLCFYAGFAEGLRAPVTLVIGDVSFLHDVNGLNLLKSGLWRQPLTIVIINNGGGGIFNFLPVSKALPKDIFNPLWSTPQNVDLQGDSPYVTNTLSAG